MADETVGGKNNPFPCGQSSAATLGATGSFPIPAPAAAGANHGCFLQIPPAHAPNYYRWQQAVEFEKQRAVAIERNVRRHEEAVAAEEMELPVIAPITHSHINSTKARARRMLKQLSIESGKHPARRRITGRAKVGVMPEDALQTGSAPMDHNENHLLAKYTKDQLEEYRQLFSMFDTDGSGAIGSEELKEAIMSIGLQVNDADIDNLIKEVDEDGNGEIDFAEFCDCMKKSQDLAKSSNEEIIRQCFAIFDQDGNGMITENEFKVRHRLEFWKKGKLRIGIASFQYIAKEIGGFTDELAEHVFHELDISSNGHLSADQFGAIVEDYLLSDHCRF